MCIWRPLAEGPIDPHPQKFGGCGYYPASPFMSGSDHWRMYFINLLETESVPMATEIIPLDVKL